MNPPPPGKNKTDLYLPFLYDHAELVKLDENARMHIIETIYDI